MRPNTLAHSSIFVIQFLVQKSSHHQEVDLYEIARLSENWYIQFTFAFYIISRKLAQFVFTYFALAQKTYFYNIKVISGLYFMPLAHILQISDFLPHIFSILNF